ncbi:MAG TPA: hypothetical protein VND65_13860, partial [Candidatus Binatia bacterium]|nr:hypothetical protein [Candidatus Binatia bacterium]
MPASLIFQKHFQSESTLTFSKETFFAFPRVIFTKTLALMFHEGSKAIFDPRLLILWLTADHPCKSIVKGKHNFPGALGERALALRKISS